MWKKYLVEAYLIADHNQMPIDSIDGVLARDENEAIEKALKMGMSNRRDVLFYTATEVK